MQLVDAPQLGELVAVEPDMDGTAAPIGDLDSGRGLELPRRIRASGRPTASAAASSASSPQLASPTGAIIPAATSRGALGAAGIEDEHVQARLGRPPGAGEPDQPAAERRSALPCRSAPLASSARIR